MAEHQVQLVELAIRIAKPPVGVEPRLTLEADTNSTVEVLKELIFAFTDIGIDEQRLIYRGRVLKDEKLLGDYGVGDKDTIKLVYSARHGSVIAAAMSDAQGEEMEKQQQQQQQQQQQAGGGFASLFSAPGMAQMQRQMQRQMMANPELMQQMMNSPMMRMMSDNPELMQNMLMQSPEIQRMIERNPQLRSVLTDPDNIRRAMEAARDPARMRELNGSNDRAIRNIMSRPGGFNALRRAYHEVQEPLMEATRDLPNRLFGEEDGDGGEEEREEDEEDPNRAPNSEPLPNPWGARPARPAASAAANPFAGMFNPMMMQQQQVPVQPQQVAVQQPTPSYTEEVQNLVELGFPDREKNLNALRQANGDVELAINLLVDELDAEDDDDEEE